MERRLPKLGMGPVLVACLIVVLGTTMIPAFAADTGNPTKTTGMSMNEQTPTDCGCGAGEDNDVVDIDGDNNSVKIVVNGDTGEVEDVVSDDSDSAASGADGAADSSNDDAANDESGGAADMDVSVDDGDVRVNGEDVANEDGDGMSNEEAQESIDQIVNNVNTDTTVNNEDITRIVNENNINGGDTSGINIEALVEVLNAADDDGTGGDGAGGGDGGDGDNGNDSTETPDDGTETPDDSTETPDDSTETPGTTTTDDSTETPGTTTPDDGTETPGTTTTTETPDDGGTADIAVDKTADEAVARTGLGVTVNFTVSVTNNGPETATDVVVNDEMPLLDNTNLGDLETSAVVLVSSDSDDGSYDPGTGNYTVNSLAAGETAEVEFTTVVVQVGQDPVNNTATLVSSTPADDTPDNNEATVGFETLVGTITEDLFAPFEGNDVLNTALATLGIDDLTDFLEQQVLAGNLNLTELVDTLDNENPVDAIITLLEDLTGEDTGLLGANSASNATSTANTTSTAVGSLPMDNVAFGGFGLVGLLGSALLFRRN